MDANIAFTPLIPWSVLWGLGAFAAVCLIISLWRDLSGWMLRTLAAMILLVALAEPSLQTEQRESLSNIVLVIVDHSESQTVSVRPEQITAAVATLVKEIGGLDGFETKIVEVTNDTYQRDGGTHLITALNRAANEVASNRFSRCHSGDRWTGA